MIVAGWVVYSLVPLLARQSQGLGTNPPQRRFHLYIFTGALFRRGNEMQNPEVGWIAAIIIGGLAGWLAEMFMKSNTGVFMNIILGIVGAAIASFLLGLVGVGFGGWLGYLIAGFIGACILIALGRMVRGSRV
jgi:uncharacterized membrane protein YeaQ/YmgE (transglycosylase-associated protein family)